MSDDTSRTDPIPETPHVAAIQDGATNETAPQVAQTFGTPQKDTVMLDASMDQAASPAPPAPAPSPAPARTGTPSRGSRATSVHPDPGFTMPPEAPPHGDATRRYLNGKVTGVLLEGMKQIAKDRPSDPLRVLGEYFLQRSRELEGTG